MISIYLYLIKFNLTKIKCLQYSILQNYICIKRYILYIIINYNFDTYNFLLKCFHV